VIPLEVVDASGRRMSGPVYSGGHAIKHDHARRWVASAVSGTSRSVAERICILLGMGTRRT